MDANKPLGRRNEHLPDMLVPYIAQAHAMEEHMVKMLEQQAARINELPDIHAHVSQFLEKTEHHLAHIEQILAMYNEPIPWEARCLPFSFALGTPAGDIEAGLPASPVRDLFRQYVFTHFEIAFYSFLATVARVCENEVTALVADEILGDKQEMQDWMLQNLPEVTVRALQHEAVPVPEMAWQFALQPESEPLRSALRVAAGNRSPLVETGV